MLDQVEVDLDMNAHANARAWHGDRKARTVKQQKTIEANKKALAVADKKVQVQLSKVGNSSPCTEVPLLAVSRPHAKLADWDLLRGLPQCLTAAIIAAAYIFDITHGGDSVLRCRVSMHSTPVQM